MTDNIEIKDVSGNIVYKTPRVRGMTKIKFLKSLIEAGITDFSNLHLDGFDFRTKNEDDFINLEGLIFDGSRIEKCRFDGKNLTGTSMKSCNITESSFAGVVSNKTWYMDGSIISNSNFDRATGTYLSIKGTNISNTKARDASFTLMDASFSTLNRIDWTGSNLRKTIWEYSHIIRNNFNKCNFISEVKHEHEKTTKSIRSNGAIFAGCKSENSKIPKGELSELKWDKNINRIGKATISMTAIGALYLIDSQLGFSGLISQLESESLKQIGSVGAFVGIYSAINFLKDNIMDKLSSNLLDIIDKISVETRKLGNHLKQYGKKITDMVVAIGKTKDLSPIIKAMETVKKSKHPLLQPAYAAKYLLSPTKNEVFIICDKNHLAQALEMLSYNRQKGMNIPQDIILLREDRVNDNVPSCIRFHKNGETTILWEKEGNLSSGVIYDTNGDSKAIIDYEDDLQDLLLSDIPNSQSVMQATITLEKHLLKENSLIDLDYDRETKYIEARTDGGFAIKNKNVKKIGNTTDSPALLIPERENSYFGKGDITGWKREYFLNGEKIIDPFELLNEFNDDNYFENEDFTILQELMEKTQGYKKEEYKEDNYKNELNF